MVLQVDNLNESVLPLADYTFSISEQALKMRFGGMHGLKEMFRSATPQVSLQPARYILGLLPSCRNSSILFIRFEHPRHT